MSISISQSGQRRRVRFLIGGLARSGTTLVQRLVTELHDVHVPPETHFWRHAETLSRNAKFPMYHFEARSSLERFLAMESSSDLVLDIDEAVASLPEESYLWDLFEAVVSSLSPHDASVLGEKTPDHLRFAPLLLSSNPDLKLLGVVRDPREVLRSQRTVPWGIKDPVSLAEKWVETTRILEDCSRMFPGRVTVLRLEDIVQNPDRARAEYAATLGVDPEAEGLSDDVLLFPKSEWWKQTALEPVETKRKTWMSDLHPSDVALVEERANIEMLRMGYELSGSVHADGEAQPTPSIPSWLAIRTDGAHIAAQPLPINETAVAAWQQSSVAQIDTERDLSAAWRIRTEEAVEEQKRLRDWLVEEKARASDAVAEQKARASDAAAEQKRLADWLGDERERVKNLEVDLSEADRTAATLAGALERAESEGARWHSRSEELQSEERRLREWVTATQIQALTFDRKRIRAEDDLARTKARRWWQLGAALGRWRRKPLRVDLFVRDVWHVLTHHHPLPAYRDLAGIDAKIADLSRKSDVLESENALVVKTLFAEGLYEDALEVLGADDRLSGSIGGVLLRRDVHTKLGETSKALADVRVARTMKDSEGLRMQERILVGRLRETAPDWLPDAGPPRRLEQAGTEAILHILKESLPFYERGYTIRSMTTLQAQRAAGYKPVVVTSLGFPRQQGFDEFAPVETIDGIDHHRLDLGPLYETTKVPYDLRLSDDAFLTARLAQDVAPAAIQAGSGYRGYETALVGLSVARNIDVPLIYEIRSFLEQTWTAEVDRSESGEYYHRRHDQEVRCLTDADHVITIAEAMKEEIIARGIDPDKISVAPNVVDTDRFAPRDKSPELLERYGLGDRPVLGYISNLGWREGIQHLVEAVKILRDGGHDVCGLVVGEGPEMDMLRHLVAEYGMETDFVLTGHVPNSQIEDHYALIDLFVVPRVNDRAARLVTPLKPLEAMSMGKPVIAADLPALRELVLPGERGFVFETENSQSLADVALEALVDTELTQRLAMAGQEWVRHDRTIAANSERYRRILGKVLAG